MDASAFLESNGAAAQWPRVIEDPALAAGPGPTLYPGSCPAEEGRLRRIVRPNGRQSKRRRPTAPGVLHGGQPIRQRS